MNFVFKNFERCVGAVAFSIMLLMVVVNVFSRYLFARSFHYTEEIAFIGFSYCVFFGACVLYRNHALISIDVVVDRLPEKARRYVRIFNFFLLLVVNVTLTVLSTHLSIGAWIRPTAALRIPYTFIDISATIAFAIMSIDSLRFLVKEIKEQSTFY